MLKQVVMEIVIVLIGLSFGAVLQLVVHHFTGSQVFTILTGFIVAELIFNIIGWLTGYNVFLWVSILFLIPFVHFTALVLSAHGDSSGGKPDA